MFEIIFPILYCLSAVINLSFFGLMTWQELKVGVELKALIVGILLLLVVSFAPFLNMVVSMFVCCYLVDTADFFKKKITIGGGGKNAA